MTSSYVAAIRRNEAVISAIEVAVTDVLGQPWRGVEWDAEGRRHGRLLVRVEVEGLDQWHDLLEALEAVEEWDGRPIVGERQAWACVAVDGVLVEASWPAPLRLA